MLVQHNTALVKYLYNHIFSWFPETKLDRSPLWSKHTNPLRPPQVVRYQVFLSVYWPDPRLKLPDFDEHENSVTMDASATEKLWLPDLIIYNLEDVQSVRLLQDLGSLKLLRNGYLKYEL